MKVVVTGATGLIGSTLMDSLMGNVDLVGLTRGETIGKLLHTDYEYKDLVSIFKGTDVVVHLAAIRGKSSDYRRFIDNAILTEDILKAAVEAKVKKVIYMSSIAVYSDNKLAPWKENQPVCPQTFYGLSKITGEHLCELYSRTGINYTVFRCAIVLGITKNNRMTDIFIRNAAEKRTLIVKGKSIAKRDYIYLKDVIRALCWGVFEDQSKNQIYNLGSGEAYTNIEIAEEINHIFENDGNMVYKNDCSEGFEDSRMDSSKIKAAGFQCKYGLSTALADIKKDWGGL